MRKVLYFFIVILIVATVFGSGCLSSNDEKIELEILSIDKINGTELIEYEIVYINQNGYVKQFPDEYDNSFDCVDLKISNSNDFKLYCISRSTWGNNFELHIPKNELEDECT